MGFKIGVLNVDGFEKDLGFMEWVVVIILLFLFFGEYLNMVLRREFNFFGGLLVFISFGVDSD